MSTNDSLDFEGFGPYRPHMSHRRERLRGRPGLANICGMKLVEFGAYVGLATGIFTVFDRLLSGRPIISLRKRGQSGQAVHILNTSKYDIFIRRVRARPRWARVADGRDDDGIFDALFGKDFVAVIAPEERREFPLLVTKMGLLEEGTELAPFVVVVSWRKTRSNWLPQFPGILISSAKSLRRLRSAK
jgi:hypothetical protein